MRLIFFVPYLVLMYDLLDSIVKFRSSEITVLAPPDCSSVLTWLSNRSSRRPGLAVPACPFGGHATVRPLGPKQATFDVAWKWRTNHQQSVIGHTPTITLLRLMEAIGV